MAPWKHQQIGSNCCFSLFSIFFLLFLELPIKLSVLLHLRTNTKLFFVSWTIYEPPHDKTNKVPMCTTKTQISLGIHPVWSESSLCAHWVAKDPSFLHADSEDSDQIGRMPTLIWVFAGRTTTLLVLSRGGSYYLDSYQTWCWSSGGAVSKLDKNYGKKLENCNFILLQVFLQQHHMHN